MFANYQSLEIWLPSLLYKYILQVQNKPSQNPAWGEILAILQWNTSILELESLNLLFCQGETIFLYKK